MNNVTALGATTTMTPRQALEYALTMESTEGMSDALVCGFYDDGTLFVFSSRMTRSDALWIAEQLKEWALHEGKNE